MRIIGVSLSAGSVIAALLLWLVNGRLFIEQVKLPATDRILSEINDQQFVLSITLVALAAIPALAGLFAAEKK